MILYLSSWTERDSEARRFWKGFDFEILNELEERELISQTRTAKSGFLTDEGVRVARELIDAYRSQDGPAKPTIVHLSAGVDGQSHFETCEPEYAAHGDRSENAELITGSGILVRRFEADRANPWHHAPGLYAVFTLCGAVDIETGDGTVQRVGPGQG